MPDSEFFDDALLDDPDALATADTELRDLALAGGRVRSALAELSSVELALDRPRAVLAAGADARLLRAVLEPVCPVPLVAWPGPGLPGWAGPMDLVVVMAGASAQRDAEWAVTEAARRGCSLLVCAPRGSATKAAADPARDAIRIESRSEDVFAGAVTVLEVLHRVGLGPAVDGDAVAERLDQVAAQCSPFTDVSINPAKELALALADSLPLLWGGSTLAARAARRVVEAVRQTSNAPALAANAEHLAPVVASQRPRDLFADPGEVLRPVLVIFDDGVASTAITEQRTELERLATSHDVRVHVISQTGGTNLERYAGLLQEGLFAHVYLGVGLGRYESEADSAETARSDAGADPTDIDGGR